jgi:CRP/FNR family transcriptional regulator, cyclic AMP receptor protein
MSDTSFDLCKIGDIDGERVTLTDGGVVFIKGDPGECAYIVASGTVEIREGGRVLEILEKDELFGEMALIESEPRSASAVAVGTAELIVLDRASFERLVRKEHGFAIMVMRLMSRRLRAANAAGRPPPDDFILGGPPRNTG